MPTTPGTEPSPPAVPARDRGDACPGALRLHSADDGMLARVRLVAGRLAVPQARALADLAERYGDGHLDLTSRGNVQLRGLGDGCSGELAERLAAVGLLPSPRHERVRNVVASPAAGLDGGGHGRVGEWAAALDDLLCGSESAPRLSGRFLFALDDGRGDVAALGADVTLLARPSDAVLRLGAGACAVAVPAADAPRAALLAAELFLSLSDASGTGAWRVRELPDDHRPTADTLAAHLRAAGLRVSPVVSEEAAEVPPGRPVGPPPGVLTAPDGTRSLSVLIRLARISTSGWRLLADLAEGAAQRGEARAAGELRVTPWRGVVLPGAGDPESLARAAADAGLITDPGSSWLGVTACTGRPGCAKSHTDVRADATATVALLARQPHHPGPQGPPPVHWSGCERRCGHPGGEWTDVTATPDGGYRVTHRAPGRAPGAAPRLAADPPALADALLSPA
ncbi:cobalamin biosynthesis protein CobG, partial [Streptomyces alkaliterrae]